ncbi:RNA methyltransferase [Ignisphaera sp. 4213-co]|uniref:RNA methyltransferase n=1 Tax=Ignisphaera cupida TaxID=3050454 RepID=A0ABD4Z7Q3_9CREN|nr:RNA methyltransferase [Ignisphaera sp. 4213-co]MDK6029037.1 RNA methyltransferase [Ignisphaera sp. 4213-co]
MNNLLQPLRTLPLVSFSIPSSIVSDVFDEREKVRKIGFVGRAAAIFRVNEIMIYVDDSRDNAEHIDILLRYQEIPPYLKKKIVRIDSRLKFAGLLQPLKSVHHVPEAFELNIRDGIVISSNEVRSVVDVGLKKHVVVYNTLPIGKRVTVLLEKETSSSYIGKIVDKNSIKWYWGFETRIFNSIEDLLKFLKSNNYLIVCASKKGNMIYDVEDNISKDFKTCEKVNVLFGGPKLDIDEIARESNIDINKYCNYIINFVPRQGVESIRTEEAIFIVLAILNYLKERINTT